MPVLMGLPKEYIGVMHLHKDINKTRLLNTCKNFIGKITQIPPVKSAVARKVREREIYSFEILQIDHRDVKFKVRCEAGVYIRKLASDIGIELGCGAHLKNLRRTKIGNFSIEECTSLAKLAVEKVLPLETVLERVKLPKIIIKNSVIDKIKNGAPLRVNDIIKMDKNIKAHNLVGFFNSGNKIIALGIAKMDYAKMEKGTIAKTERVFKL